MELVIASNNKNKVKEIKCILAPYFTKIYSLSEIGISAEIEETGVTFKENALIKAKAIHDMCNIPVIADDSGLCVNSLGGAPGVYSARYSGEPCDDERNNDKLLKELEDKADRTGYYECSICLYFNDNDIMYGNGRTYGRILNERRGKGGFGYDPLFLSDDLNKTLAEISLEEKNTISHRARAINDILNQLKERNIL